MSSRVRTLLAALLTTALALWRGEPLTGIPIGTVVIAELTKLVQRHPEQEHLWALLIQALCRSGRQGDALAAYRRVHMHLRDELGVDPGTDG